MRHAGVCVCVCMCAFEPAVCQRAVNSVGFLPDRMVVASHSNVT